MGFTDFYSHDNAEMCCCGEVCDNGRETKEFNETFPDMHGLGEGGGYITDVVTEAALEEIAGFKEREEDRLFLTITMPATHAGPEDVPQYKDEDLDPSLLARSPLRAGFDAMMSNLDANIERVVAKMASERLLDDTLLVVVGDNGGSAHAGSSVYPLRGEKFAYFDGGIRTPGLVKLPGQREGRELRDLVWIGDLAPTILEAVGGKGGGAWTG